MKKDDYKYLGVRLKELRLQMGLSQTQVADHAGISVRSYQRMENSEVIPGLDLVSKVAEVLKMDLGMLSRVTIKSHPEVFLHSLNVREHLSFFSSEYTTEEVDWLYDDGNFRIRGFIDRDSTYKILLNRFNDLPFSVGFGDNRALLMNKEFIKTFNMPNDNGIGNISEFFSSKKIMEDTFLKMLNSNSKFWVLKNKVTINDHSFWGSCLVRECITESGHYFFAGVCKKFIF